MSFLPLFAERPDAVAGGRGTQAKQGRARVQRVPSGRGVFGFLSLDPPQRQHNLEGRGRRGLNAGGRSPSQGFLIQNLTAQKFAVLTSTSGVTVGVVSTSKNTKQRINQIKSISWRFTWNLYMISKGGSLGNWKNYESNFTSIGQKVDIFTTDMATLWV
jgi:hypothetical protein